MDLEFVSVYGGFVFRGFVEEVEVGVVWDFVARCCWGFLRFCLWAGVFFLFLRRLILVEFSL